MRMRQTGRKTPVRTWEAFTGTREGSVGGASYVFPLVQSRDIRLLDDADSASGNRRPWVTIGIGGGSGGVGGGIGVLF